jgi:hypothetical protein
MILDPPRPRRRLGRIVVPIVLTIAAVVAIIVANAGTDTRSELDYLDEMQGAVSDIAVGADSLIDVSGKLNVTSRVEFVTVTDSLRSTIASALALTRAGPPTDELVAVNSLYRQALQAWNRGITRYSSGVLVAADEPDNANAADRIADALAELRAGDNLYAALVEELARDDVPDPVAPMPEVVLMPVTGGLISAASTLVEAARSSMNALAFRPGLGVAQLVADPEWVVNPDDLTVVPATDAITFSVVVENPGNVKSRRETLTLTVTGGPDIVEQSIDVEPLEPGRRRTLVFDAVPVEAGVTYDVAATLMVRHPDFNLDDNQISVVFTVNETDTES